MFQQQRVAAPDRVLALAAARFRLQVSHVVAKVRLVAGALVAGQCVLVDDRYVAHVDFRKSHNILRLQLIHAARMDIRCTQPGHVAVGPNVFQTPARTRLHSHRHQVGVVHVGTRLVA